MQCEKKCNCERDGVFEGVELIHTHTEYLKIYTFQRPLHLELQKWQMSILSLTGVSLISKTKKPWNLGSPRIREGFGDHFPIGFLNRHALCHQSDSAVVKSLCSRARLPGFLSYLHYLLERFSGTSVINFCSFTKWNNYSTYTIQGCWEN